jgi:hypothetical protein
MKDFDPSEDRTYSGEGPVISISDLNQSATEAPKCDNICWIPSFIRFDVRNPPMKTPEIRKSARRVKIWIFALLLLLMIRSLSPFRSQAWYLRFVILIPDSGGTGIRLISVELLCLMKRYHRTQQLGKEIIKETESYTHLGLACDKYSSTEKPSTEAGN